MLVVFVSNTSIAQQGQSFTFMPYLGAVESSDPAGINKYVFGDDTPEGVKEALLDLKARHAAENYVDISIAYAKKEVDENDYDLAEFIASHYFSDEQISQLERISEIILAEQTQTDGKVETISLDDILNLGEFVIKNKNEIDE